MSVRNSLLAILTLGPCYGSQLKAEFERRTDSAWPLNVGQVYTTLARLARDGLVERLDGDEDGRERFEITDAGRAAVTAWHRGPVPVGASHRDEFVMKVVVAQTLPGADVGAMLAAQVAQASVACRPTHEPVGPAAALVAAAEHEQAEAQLRWVEHVRKVAPRPQWGLDPELPKRGRPHKSEPGEPRS